MTKWQTEKILAEELYDIVSPKLSNYLKERPGITRTILKMVIEAGYRKVEKETK